MILLFAVLVPAPFKPSLWSYLYKRDINKQLTKSTKPIFLPDITKFSNQSYEIHKNWVDAYIVRTGIGHGTRGVYYYQFTLTSQFGADSEGLEQDEIDMLVSLQGMSNCEKLDDRVEICTIPATEHKSYNLTRKISERQFARYNAEPATNTILLAELTTNAYKDGYKIDDGIEYMNYKLLDETERTIILNVLRSTKSQPLAQVKNLFSPEY